MITTCPFVFSSEESLLSIAEKKCKDSFTPALPPSGFATVESCVAHALGELIDEARVKTLLSNKNKKKIVSCKRGIPARDLVVCFDDPFMSSKYLKYPDICHIAESCIQNIVDEAASALNDCSRYYSDDISTGTLLLDCQNSAKDRVKKTFIYEFRNNSTWIESLERAKFNFYYKRYIPYRGMHSMYRGTLLSINELIQEDPFLLLFYVLICGYLLIWIFKTFSNKD